MTFSLLFLWISNLRYADFLEPVCWVIVYYSDSDAGVKEEKLEGLVGGEGECGDEVEVLLVREIRELQLCSNRHYAIDDGRSIRPSQLYSQFAERRLIVSC